MLTKRPALQNKKQSRYHRHQTIAEYRQTRQHKQQPTDRICEKKDMGDNRSQRVHALYEAE